jgi:hypothetical protein
MNQFWRSIRKSSLAIFLIVAMLFGSFSQIAQARTGDLCLGHNVQAEAGASEQAAANNTDEHCDEQASLGVFQEGAADQDHSSDKTANHGCCAAHCCVMKGIDKADYNAPYHPMKESPLFVYESVHSSDFLFGIFRPPRLVV